MFNDRTKRFINDQEKMTFTCPLDTLAYKCTSFVLCNVLTTFQRCMSAMFSALVEDFLEILKDDFFHFLAPSLIYN